MKKLHEPKICRFFEEIAESTWNRIIEAHEVGVDLPEIGITADILVKILQYSKSTLPNFEAYAKKGWNEKKYGSDIDVFLEVGRGQFVWFALQAKILKKDNRYTTLRDTSDTVMQWEKLALLESLSGCKGYYLLYNGIKGFNFHGNDSCSNSFSESQFGCSLVEPTIIEKLANIKKGGRYVNPTFQDIHPDNAEPWRTLVCCNQNIFERELYLLNEILGSDSSFYKLEEVVPKKEKFEEDPSYKDSEENIELIINNRINGYSRLSGWNPLLRLIIYTTTAKKSKFGI